MFIEYIIDLVNKFVGFGIKDFRVEFSDNYLHIYTNDKLTIKTRNGNAIGPVFVHKDEFITQVYLENHQFLADGKVYHEQYSYDEKKEDIRAIVREEIKKFLEECYSGKV